MVSFQDKHNIAIVFSGTDFFPYQNVSCRQALAQRLLVAGIGDSVQCQSKKPNRR